MRVLIIADEVWNDNIHGNNVLTNWFSDFPAEFAEIYCSPGEPYNSCCKKYFQLTDTMMLKSILGKNKAGKIHYYKDYPRGEKKQSIESENVEFYSTMKKITGDFLRLIREYVWLTGQYDIKNMKRFISEFDPDIIFCPRMSSAKLLRLEKTVQKISKKPIVAFTGDDEYSLAHIKISPFYWVRRFMIRSAMRKQIPSYSLYYTHSVKQAKEYHKFFKVPVKNLYKCGTFLESKIHRETNSIIKITYIGKIYVNRWKTLGMIGDILREVNKNGTKMILEIYTKDKLTSKQRKKLNDGDSIILKGAVNPEDIQKVYDQSDIALHVESFDTKNMLETRYSFSTKIIDCLASGCAVMAVCNPQQAGFDYLRRNNAALTAGSKEELQRLLTSIAINHSLIQEYAKCAYLSGVKLHNKRKTQEMLYSDFQSVISKYNKRLINEDNSN